MPEKTVDSGIQAMRRGKETPVCLTIYQFNTLLLPIGVSRQKVTGKRRGASIWEMRHFVVAFRCGSIYITTLLIITLSRNHSHRHVFWFCLCTFPNVLSQDKREG